MMKFLLGTIAATALLLGGFFVGQTYYSPLSVATAPQAGNFNTTGGGTYNLQATITSNQTTIQLSSFTEPQSGIPYTMSYLNSSIEYATIAPQTSQSEFISFTGITQNSDGSATLTGVQRGLDRSFPYTASTTLALPHAGQSRLILSNPPQLYNSYGALANANTWVAVNTFGSTTPPTYDADPVWANFSGLILASVDYVNQTASAGAANASETVKGLVQLATAAQAALGTSLGSTGARLALGNNLATSTPGNSTVSGDVPTLTGSTLNSNFINQAAIYAWSALHTFSAGILVTASSTFNATTSQACSNILSNACKFNTIPYQFPSSQGAANTVWVNNGSGVLTSQTPGSITGSFFLGATTTGATTVGQTNVEKTVVSGITLPANTLSTNGAFYFKLFWATYTDAGGNTQGTLRLKLGGTTMCTFILNAAPSTVGNGYADFMIMSNGSASSQICIEQATYLGQSSVTTFPNTIDSTGAINTTSSQPLTLTFQWADQTDSETFTVNSAYANSFGHQ